MKINFTPIIFISIFYFLSASTFAQKNEQKNTPKPKIIEKEVVTYKKYQKFEFTELDVVGEDEFGGELTVSESRYKRSKVRLPQRTNFDLEIRRSVIDLK